MIDVIKLRNDGFEGNIKKCAPLFFGNLNFFDGSPYFDFECRVVRFKISDDTYESIITNLDESEFNIQDIKELYHLR